MLQMIGLLEEDDGDHSGSDYGDSGDEHETSDEEHHSGSEADPLSDAESDEEECKFEFEPISYSPPWPMTISSTEAKTRQHS